MKIIEEQISKQELLQIADFVFTKSQKEDDELIIKELIAIGKCDSERFAAICNYHLEHEYEKFQLIIKPVLKEMLESYIVK